MGDGLNKLTLPFKRDQENWDQVNTHEQYNRQTGKV